jgi:hypothetical protein
LALTSGHYFWRGFRASFTTLLGCGFTILRSRVQSKLTLTNAHCHGRRVVVVVMFQPPEISKSVTG